MLAKVETGQWSLEEVQESIAPYGSPVVAVELVPGYPLGTVTLCGTAKDLVDLLVGPWYGMDYDDAKSCLEEGDATPPPPSAEQTWLR